MSDQQNVNSNGDGNGKDEYSERDHQRQILEKILKKSKVKLDDKEASLMDDLIAELDLLHLRRSDLDSKLADAPGLLELILMAREEEGNEEEVEEVPEQPTIESGLARVSPSPQEQNSEDVPESSVARIGPPKKPKKSTRPRSVLKQKTHEKEQESEPEPEQKHQEPVAEPQPEPEEKKTTSAPEHTVRKFIEAWNQKAFGAEYACFSKSLLNMGKEEYVDTRMSIYLSETKLRSVIRKMGTLMSKKVYGNNAEILCERIVQTGPKTEIFIDDYSLSIEDGEWKIRAVRSEPDRSGARLKKRPFRKSST